MHNVVLKPGNNTVSLRGSLDVNAITENLSDILTSQRTALLQGKFQLSASGNSTIYNGVHISYYEEILNNLTLTAQVSVLEVLTGTLENLLNNGNNSPLSKIVHNIINILSGVSDSTDFRMVARSLQALV
jgi:hypothetical protein